MAIGATRFTGLHGMIKGVQSMAFQHSIKTTKEAARGIGVIDLLIEIAEEIPENWDQSSGDPLSFITRTATEVAVGLGAMVVVEGAGAYVGSFALGTIGGMIGGPIGAVIGAKVGSFVGAIAASYLFEIGGVEVTEWLEDRVSDVAVDLVEEGWQQVESAIDKVASFFGL